MSQKTPGTGKFKNKHKDIENNPHIQDDLKKNASAGEITCAMVHRIAKKNGIPPVEVGKQADLIELRFIQCQLGLFGWGPPDGKTIDTGITVTDDLHREIDQAAENGSITCTECWNIAGKLKIKRKDVGSACEMKNLKIKQCQIGAF